MKCEDIRLQLVPWLRGELSEEQEAAVKLHLSSCSGCTQEYKVITQTSTMLANNKVVTKAPEYLEGRIRQRFKQRYPRRHTVPKAAVAALMALAIFTTVYAQATTGFLTDWDSFLNLFAHGDQGIQHSLLQGAGQTIHQEQTINGVTVHLHSLIADGNRTVALFSVDGPRDADFVRINRFKIIDSDGSRYNQTGAFTYSEGKVAGKIETVSAHQLGAKIGVEFSGITFGRTHVIDDWELDLNGQFPQSIALENGLGEILLESVAVAGDKLTMVIRANLSDPQSSLLLNLYQGEMLVNDQRIMSEDYIESTWTLNDPDISRITMYIEYQETLAAIQEPLSFSITVDKDKVQQHTVTHKLDKTIELEPGVQLDFEQIIATSSQTVVEFRVKGEEGNRAILPYGLDMTLESQGQEVQYSQDYQGGKFYVKIDPTIPIEGLVLKIHGYYRSHTGSSQYQLPGDKEQMIDLNGIPLTVSSINRQDSAVHFRISALDGQAIIDTAALIIDGKELASAEIFYRQDPGEKALHFDIFFQTQARPETWTLQLGWQEYRDCNLVIPLP